jgi:exodeoxyribonuclease VII small subunit
MLADDLEFAHCRRSAKRKRDSAKPQRLERRYSTTSHYSIRSTTILGMSETPDFETALKRLEEIVKKLENGELSLDSALQLFEEGIKLSRFCHTKLEEAERRVEILVKNSSGQPRAVAFESENEQ